MRDLEDLLDILDGPTVRVSMCGVVVRGIAQPVPPIQAAPRLVHSVYEDRCFFEDGSFIPLGGCCGNSEVSFDKDRDDRFFVQVGPARITYEIGHGVVQ